MKRFAVFCLAFVTIAFVGCSKFAVQPKVTPSSGTLKIIWTGNSAGYAIRWTTADITAVPLSNPNGQALSDLGLTVFDFHAASHMQTGDCDFVRVSQLQSVVGPIVSILDQDTMKCANGASGANRKTVAIDLRHPQAPALLSDYFPAYELASLALRASRVCSSKPQNLLGGFAFEQLHGNAVVVNVTLPQTCSQQSLSVAVNVPVKFRLPLALAARRRQGFLLKDQPLVSNGQTTTINYHYRTSST